MGLKHEDKFILSGPEELLPLPATSLGRYLLNNLVDHKDQIAQIHAVTGESLTFSKLVTLSLSVAESLRLRGVQNGDVIGICSENNLEFCVPVLAALFLGAACAPLNPAYTIRELNHSLNISKPSIMFCSSRTAPLIEQVKNNNRCIREIIVFGSSCMPQHTPFERLTRNKHPNVAAFDDGTNTRVAAILCSSGTTGLPKGVMLTDANILTCISHIKDVRFSDFMPNDVNLGILPYFHAYGYVATLCLLSVGMKTVVLPKFEEEIFLRTIQNYKVTLLTLVPPLVVFLAKHPLVSRYDLSSIRGISCGAAPLGEDVQNLVKKRLNIIHIRQGYGMTETTLGVLRTPTENNKFGSSGKLAPGTLCKVVDLKTGESVGPNIRGELCFKGPMIMKGYIGDLDATSACTDEDGFLHTGDVGYYDEDEFFFIVDRLKELIKYKGFQVPPAELEDVLLTNPAIKDAAVIGVPDENSGELPLAFIVLQPGKKLSESDIIKFVEGQVSPQKRLRGGVKFVNSIPKTASGKILRRELRQILQSKL